LAPLPLALPLEPDGEVLFFGWVDDDPAMPPDPAEPLEPVADDPLLLVPPPPALPAGRSQPARSALESASANTTKSFCFIGTAPF
jgi:hypothetical protein